jgi:hypothetical protein
MQIGDLPFLISGTGPESGFLRFFLVEEVEYG